jgi:hypothetical protein
MNLLNFISQYPDEKNCKLRLKAIRDKKGCYYATFLLLQRKVFFALELQLQLGHKYYEPIWAMLHMLWLAMGKRDSQYSLSGQIKLDERFFSTKINPEEKENLRKRGRGSQKMSKVLVMAESKEVEGKATKKGKPRTVGFIKMQVISNIEAETINEQVQANISKEFTLITDDSTSYTGLGELVKKHHAQVIPKKQVGEISPWVNLAISNTKRMLLDIHHNIKPDFLQGYLNEFCYKFNRRYIGKAMIYRLLLVSATSKNKFRY